MKIKEVYVRWLGIPVIAVIMSFIYGPERDVTFGQKYLMSLAFTTFYWNGSFLIFTQYRKKFPEISLTVRRLALTVFTVISFFLLGDLLIFFFTKTPILSVEGYTLNHSIPSLSAGIIIGLIYETVYFFEMWKHSIKMNEALKHQQMRTQFEVLQNQMSPHFLFNSLNTLTAIIPEDADAAVEFTQKLSEVYRYILQNKERELVSLKEELDFVEAYVFLLKMRYPENLHVDFRIEQKQFKQSIAPLTLQILIENSIKHNVISKTKPLHIEVYVENGKSIVVKNNLQVKKVIEKSTKTGLANIQKRYELLGNKDIDIITTAKNFLVAVPLLHVVQQKEQELVLES